MFNKKFITVQAMTDKSEEEFYRLVKEYTSLLAVYMFSDSVDPHCRNKEGQVTGSMKTCPSELWYI